MTNDIVVDQRNVFVRFFLYVVNRFRPPLGWVVWCVGLLIALLPAIAIREAAWIDLGRVRVTPEWVSFFRPVERLVYWWTGCVTCGNAPFPPESNRPWTRAAILTCRRIATLVGSPPSSYSACVFCSGPFWGH